MSDVRQAIGNPPPHHVDSTRHPGQAEALWQELCAAKARVAELEAALLPFVAIHGRVTVERERAAAQGWNWPHDPYGTANVLWSDLERAALAAKGG